MKKIKIIRLLFNNAKLIKEYEELEDIVQTQGDVIEDLNQELREYELFTETDLLIARKKELEGLVDHYHVQQKEYRKKIIKLQETIAKLKEEIYLLKTNKA